jgi:hypothetical protein
MRLLFWAVLLLMFPLMGGCGSNTPGKMEWVQPHTVNSPRVGTVYAIRGWMGIFSGGIDKMAKDLRAQGVHAYCFQDMQYEELAVEMVNKYKGVKNPEPIVFIGHSRGVDAALIISRKLQEVGVPVELIISLDSVDQTVVTKNVRACYNYWMPGFFPGTNLLRGIPLEHEPGATGVLYNINLNRDAPQLKDPLTTHAVIDKAPALQAKIVEHVLEACPPRDKWNSGTHVPNYTYP